MSLTRLLLITRINCVFVFVFFCLCLCLCLCLLKDEVYRTASYYVPDRAPSYIQDECLDGQQEIIDRIVLVVLKVKAE